VWDLDNEVFEGRSRGCISIQTSSPGHEIFAVLFDDSVCLHGGKETHEAPEMSFASTEIPFHAIIISIM